MFNLINDEKIKSFSDNLFGNMNVLVLNNKPYFPADYVSILLQNDTSTISRVCKLEDPHAVNHNMFYQIGVRAFNEPILTEISTLFIDEDNVRELVSISASDTAKDLEKWIFEEIIPSFKEK